MHQGDYPEIKETFLTLLKRGEAWERTRILSLARHPVWTEDSRGPDKSMVPGRSVAPQEGGTLLVTAIDWLGM